MSMGTGERGPYNFIYLREIEWSTSYMFSSQLLLSGVDHKFIG